MSGPLLHDAKWVRQSFLVAKGDLDARDFAARTHTTAAMKFTDTTPGGNFAINPPPQFTSTADIKAPGVLVKNKVGNGTRGMGRYYSEAIDDNAQIIYMRFGVPEFNSLTTFFTGFYDSAAGQLARSGRSNGVFHTLGVALGFVISAVWWPLIAVNFIGMALRFAAQKPSSKFYYLKPAMPLYWNAVSTMVNDIAVKKGIVPRLFGSDQNAFSQDYEFDVPALERLHKMLPEIFNEGGGINVYAMAGRAQRLARRWQKEMESAVERSFDYESLQLSVQQVADAGIQDEKKQPYVEYLKKWFSKPEAAAFDTSGPTVTATDSTQSATTANANYNNTRPSPGSTSNANVESIPKTKEDYTSLMDFLATELDDGSAFASFRVNATGQISESFSNSVTESDLAGKINGMSSSSRSTRFDFAEGNIGGGAIGSMIGAVGGAITDIVKGVGEGLSISGLATLGGAAFVDIPKHWQSSMASLPRANYTINLVSPYGNPISQLINLHIPLAMLLAGALPLSTGKQSYTSPFLVELYDQGRCQVRLGMIDSLSISRGTGNLGFDNQGRVMGIDVSFSVVDMSTIMHMPISEGFSMDALNTGLTVGAIAGGVTGILAGGVIGSVAGPVGTVTGAAAGGAVGTAVGTGVGLAIGEVASGIDVVRNAFRSVNNIFSDDTAFTDYMSVLAGLGLADQIYSSRKIKLNLTRAMSEWKNWYSPAHYASVIGDTFPARLVSAWYKGAVR